MDGSSIVVVGSLNTDFSVYTEKFPSDGETLFGTASDIGLGGKGCNQCVAASLLGSKVAMIGKVGADQFGDNFVTKLNDFSIDTAGIFVAQNASTGAAFITVEQSSGENRIIVIPGSNSLLTIEDVDEADKLGIFDCKIAVCQFEISPATTLHALKTAKHKGLTTILNPAPMSLNSTLSDELVSLLPNLLGSADFCCPNEVEAVQLVNLCRSGTKHATDDEEDDRGIVSCLIDMHCHGVAFPLITLGSLGLIAMLPLDQVSNQRQLPKDVQVTEQMKMKGCDYLIVRILAPTIQEIIDTSGAGDAFVGALAHYLSAYPDLKLVEKYRRAIWIASQSICKSGTQKSYTARVNLPPQLFSKTGTFEWLS